MQIDFRKCEYSDLDYILKLKELGMKWYIEKIYGWDKEFQKVATKKELDKHINDMRIILVDGSDAGVTTFFEEDNKYVVGLILIHPDHQGKGIATKIISEYIDTAKKDKKEIKIKTYKENPARRLYERLGFKIYEEDKTHVHMSIDFREEKK